MSALDINNIEKYALQDNYSSLSSGLGSDWQSLESAFEKEFLGSAKTNFTSSDLIAHLLEYDITDDDLDTPFMSLIHSESASAKFNEERNVGNISYSDLDTDVANSSSCWETPDKIVDITKDDFLASGSSTFLSAENEEHRPIDNFKEKETSTQSTVCSPAKSKTSSKKKSKKSCVTRSVITETIFNGSIADIVKTRKRGAAKEYDAESIVDQESYSSKQVSTLRNVPLSSSVKEECDADQLIPKIKLCIKLKKCDAVKEEKAKSCTYESTKEKNFHSSTKKSRKAGSEKEVNKKLKKQMKKQKKPNVKLNVPEPPEICPSLDSESVESGLESNISSPYNSPSSVIGGSTNDSHGGLPIPIVSEEKNPIVNTITKVDVSEIKPEDVRPEIVESAIVHAPPKKKLRGIEEYKALRAKIKPAGKTSPHINNLVLDDVTLTVPKLNHDDVINQLQKHLDSKKADSVKKIASAKKVATVIDLPLLKYGSPSVKAKISNAGLKISKASSDSTQPNVSLASKIADVSSQNGENKEQIAQHSLPSVMPLNSSFSVKKSEPVEICAKTFSPIDHSASHIPLMSNASLHIPTQIKSEKRASEIGSSQDSPSAICDKNKAETQVNLSVPSRNVVPDSGLSNSASESTVSRVDIEQDTSEAAYSPTMPVLPFGPSSPNDKPQRRQYRRRYVSCSSDSRSDSTYHSNSSPRRRSSRDSHSQQKADRRGKRLRSQKSARNPRYSNLNKSSSYRYKRRSSSRSRSCSRHSSSSLSDSIYEAYGSSSKRSRHCSSKSPVVSGKSRYPSKYQRSSPSESAYTSRHSSKSPLRNATKDRSRYSPSRRRYRRHDRHRSSSSYSTADSYSRHRDSSSSSRSRSRERYHRHYQPSRSSSRQQPNRWEEQQRQIDERRVVYVGVIPDGYTQAELYERFSCFGSIEDVRIHARESRNDNYGFVTFRDKEAAYRAVERGNDHPHEPKFGISFGGRRRFCKQRYSDLDKENEMSDDHDDIVGGGGGGGHDLDQRDLSFDNLLKAELQRIKVRGKKC